MNFLLLNFTYLCYFFYSIVFLVIPIITNLILVFHIFITECMDNNNYLVWFKNNSQPAAIITILCGGDITALKLLSSNLAGFELFNAPLSEKAEKYIYYGGILNIFLEDLPQLIIQVIDIIYVYTVYLIKLNLN